MLGFKDMHVYISESDRFTQFDDAKYLFWLLENIEYGNWVDGVNNDGAFMQTKKIELTEVSYRAVCLKKNLVCLNKHVVSLSR